MNSLLKLHSHECLCFEMFNSWSINKLSIFNTKGLRELFSLMVNCFLSANHKDYWILPLICLTTTWIIEPNSFRINCCLSFKIHVQQIGLWLHLSILFFFQLFPYFAMLLFLMLFFYCVFCSFIFVLQFLKWKYVWRSVTW